MDEKQLPEEFKPEPSKPIPGVGNCQVEQFYLAIHSAGSYIDGPFETVEEALATHPQHCQGGLYREQSNFFVVRQAPDCTKTVIYKWNLGGQKWVREGQ